MCVLSKHSGKGCTIEAHGIYNHPQLCMLELPCHSFHQFPNHFWHYILFFYVVRLTNHFCVLVTKCICNQEYATAYSPLAKWRSFTFQDCWRQLWHAIYACFVYRVKELANQSRCTNTRDISPSSYVCTISSFFALEKSAIQRCYYTVCYGVLAHFLLSSHGRI